MKRVGLGLALFALVGLTACQATPIGGSSVEEGAITDRIVGEYKLAGGDRVRVSPEVSVEALRRVIEVLRGGC